MSIFIIQVSISKAEVGFELDILEQACKLAVEESSDVNQESNVDFSLQESTKSTVESGTQDSSESEYTDTDSTETESEDEDSDEVSENEPQVDSVPTVCSQLDNLTLSSKGLNPRLTEEANVFQMRSPDGIVDSNTTESTRDNLIEEIETSIKNCQATTGAEKENSSSVNGTNMHKDSIVSQVRSHGDRQHNGLKDYSKDTGLEKPLNDCKISQVKKQDSLSAGKDEIVFQNDFKSAQQTESNENTVSKQLNPRDSSSLNF